jgi:integrase
LLWWIRYYRNGRRFEESARTNKKEEARDLLKRIEGDIAKGVPVTSITGRLRFEEAATDIEADYQINGKRSLRDLKIRIERHLTPFLAGRRMNSITTADVRAYSKQRIDAGAKPATVNRELSALRRMFVLAVKAGKVMVRPHIPMLAENNVRTGFFERETFEAVRAALPEDVRPIATFAYLTGWRLSEILSLQWRQIDLQVGTVRLDPGTTKNRDGRLFPYRHHLPELRDLLDAQRRATTAVETRVGVICPWVFHRRGKRVRTLRGAWTAACETAGCPWMLRHDFRRTAVRNLERAGVSRSVAMQLTGHRTEAVYRRYAIVSEQDSAKGSRSSVNSRQGQSRGQNGEVRAFGNSRKHEILGNLDTPGWRNWQTHRT